MSLLFRNVKILGGERAFNENDENVDVFISGGKISAIGNFSNKNADKIIDGGGAYLSPGFVDVNTDSDHYLSLIEYPEQEDFLKQGVTTIIGGMCGSSLAPLLYGSLESIQKWGDIEKINVDWRTLDDFLSIFKRKPLAVNFATLVGHSTVRRAILGEQIRDLTKNELIVFGETLKRSIAEGAFGMSTGLEYAHSKKTVYNELKYLAKIVAESDAVYATHLRKSGEGIEESVDETIKLANETKVKTIISHFEPLVGAEKEYASALEKIDSLPKEKDFNFDLYPSDTTINALYTFLPDWAKTGGLDVMIENIQDDWLRSKIMKDLPDINPKNFIVAQAKRNEFLIGKSLDELTSIYETRDHKETVMKLMLVTKLRAVIFYKNINYSLAKKAMKSPRALIGSNSASFAYSGKLLKHERSTSTFIKFIDLAVKENLMPIEDAIRKITLEPAKKFNIKNRGVLKEGYWADLALFSIKNPIKNENCVNVKAVVVNGKIVIRDSAFSGNFPGMILKHDLKQIR